MIVSNSKDARKQSARPSILVFDVNEGLLDIGAIAPLFARVFGDGQLLLEWFAQLVLYSNVVTPSGVYEMFFVLAQGVLRMLGDIHKVYIHASDMAELRTRMLNARAPGCRARFISSEGCRISPRDTDQFAASSKG